MSWMVLIPILLLDAIVFVLMTCLLAWFILSRWLEDRSLIIASVACAVAAGLGRSSNGERANGDAVALLSAAVTILVGLLVAKVWLARWKGQFDG